MSGTRPIFRTGQELASPDQLEQQKLMLYKSLSSLQELKKIYFYVQVIANQTTVPTYANGRNRGKVYNPIQGRYRAENYYYNLIGTTRRFELGNQMSELLNLTVEKNRTKYQLNLEECQISQDTLNFTRQRALVPVKRLDGVELYELESTYNVSTSLGAIPASSWIKQNIGLEYYQEANRTVTPEPLYCRIKELTNEPYQWVSQPSGSISLDKSHQPIIIDDINKTPTLTLEFGHLIFTGRDDQYYRTGIDGLDPSSAEFRDWKESGVTSTKANADIRHYNQFEYTDFNEEVANVTTQSENIYNSTLGSNLDCEYVFPANRSNVLEFGTAAFGDPNPAKIYLASRPLKSNQQANSIMFKFSLTVLGMF
jgi:hypothetical protein